ncbi:InlB B-repeat-containing protein [Murdochiella sp. Marseille-P8839]|nr:InlB B-repeat-containing protein [Murdochiella sp. Marseille-P8839]
MSENPTDPVNPENPADPQNPNEPGTNLGTNPGSNSGTTPMVQQYTITVDGNGGKWSDGKTTLLLSGEKGSYIKLPIAPVKPGYTFLYWKGSVYYPGDYYLVQGDHTLMAEWKENTQEPEDNTDTNPETTPENKPGTNPETPENKPGTNPEATPGTNAGTNPEATPGTNAGTNPETPGQSSDQAATPQDTLTETERTTDNEVVAPKTGDYTILIVSALALLAMGSGLYLMRKKENEQ